MFLLVTLLILFSCKKYLGLGLLHIESKLTKDFKSTIATHNESKTNKPHQKHINKNPCPIVKLWCQGMHTSFEVLSPKWSPLGKTTPRINPHKKEYD